jgi:WD40 repeat protein
VDAYRNRKSDEIVETTLEYLHKILPSSVLLAPARLEGLINQAWSYQMTKCDLHLNDVPTEPIANEFILKDHSCTTNNFPSRCSQVVLEIGSFLSLKEPKITSYFQVLQDHRSEVWCVKFSPCGRFLATGSKNPYIYIWQLDDSDELKMVYYRRLIPPSEISGVAALSWSHDSRFLAVAGSESNQSGIFLFNVTNGIFVSEVRPNNREAFCAVSFFGNKSYRFACADRFGHFQCHVSGSKSIFYSNL